MMKTKFFVVGILALVFSASFVFAHSEPSFAEAEQIIQQQISCDDLTQNQLEILGDYYMEQIHPGEQHEYMDEMMGGEGSDSLRAMHINMGISFYCDGNEVPQATNYEMMGRMYPGRTYPNYQTQIINPLLGFLIAALVVVIAILLVKGKK